MYTVKQGDYLAKIAKKHGMADWRRIYEHEENVNFRKKRPNPDLLYPGDKIFVPDKESKEESCITEKKHSFILQKARPLIHIELVGVDGNAMPVQK